MSHNSITLFIYMLRNHHEVTMSCQWYLSLSAMDRQNCLEEIYPKCTINIIR